MRRALILLAAVSAAAAVGLAVFGIEAATAALAVSWLCGLAWMVLSARATSTTFSQVLEHQRASLRELRQMQTRLSEQSKLEQQTASQVSGVRKDLFRVLVWVQRTPSVTHELGRLYDRLAAGSLLEDRQLEVIAGPPAGPGRGPARGRRRRGSRPGL